MKRDYNLWKLLKNGEMGLGWDASAQKLDCADNWWKMKIKLQYAWDQIYGDVVAGGEDCVSSTMNTKAFQEVHNENAEDKDDESDDDLDDTQEGTQVDNFEMEELQNTEPSFFKSFIDEVNLADTTTPSNQSGIPKKVQKPTKSNTKPKTINMKRRGR
ncbi:hypothetical protein Tco_0757582 [Tanacetum coccineum]